MIAVVCPCAAESHGLAVPLRFILFFQSGNLPAPSHLYPTTFFFVSKYLAFSPVTVTLSSSTLCSPASTPSPCKQMPILPSMALSTGQFSLTGTPGRPLLVLRSTKKGSD